MNRPAFAPPPPGTPRACESCRARGHLLRELAGEIEVAAAGAAGGVRELLALTDERLAVAVAPDRAGEAVAAAAERARAEDANDAGTWSVCRHADGWPEALDDLAGQAPRALWGAGRPAALSGPAPDDAVTIVGARRCSEYGRRVARALAAELAGAGLTIVSGLALGIDSEAHTGALATGGATLAVLGAGADLASPRSRAGLRREILRSGGAVVGELPPGTEARRWTFPARNRVMAALGGLTVVVEAAQRSGSLITAEMAADLGRELGAVPGPVTSAISAGSNALLRDGAAVIRDGQDVLDSLLGVGVVALRRPTGIDAASAAILEAVDRGADTLDRLALALGRAAGPLSGQVARLEARDLLVLGAVGTLARPPGPRE